METTTKPKGKRTEIHRHLDRINLCKARISTIFREAGEHKHPFQTILDRFAVVRQSKEWLKLPRIYTHGLCDYFEGMRNQFERDRIVWVHVFKGVTYETRSEECRKVAEANDDFWPTLTKENLSHHAYKGTFERYN